MPTPSKYPGEWLEQIPAVVFAVLQQGEIRITVLPGVGIADGGYPWDIPIELVPLELRMPNTPLWVHCDDGLNVLRIWHREVER